MGKTWKMFSSDVFKAMRNKIKEDPVSKDLLFLGTEMGLYTSIDGGNKLAADERSYSGICYGARLTIEPKNKRPGCRNTRKRCG